MKKLFYLLSATSIVLLLCGCNNEKNKYEIKLDCNGGTLDNTTIMVEEGSEVTLPTPVKEDKHFLGWYLGYGLFDKELSSTKDIKESTTLYARWDTYELNYYDYDGNLLMNTTRPDGAFAYNYGLDFNTPPNPIHQDLDFKLQTKTDDTLIKVNINAYLEDKYYTIPFLYNDDYFLESPYTNQKNLSLYSYALSVSTKSEESLNHILNESGFTDIYYYGFKTQEDVSYAIAKKTLDGTNYVFVILRGFYYTNEWVGNFKIGLTGNHQGFSLEAEICYNDLLDKISGLDMDNTKMLITGYSKAGSVSELLATKLITTNIINKENLYTYTYLAPHCSETIPDYPIWNFINRADLLSNIIPLDYCLYFCGNRYDTEMEKDIESLYFVFDPSLKFPKFTKTNDYSSISIYPSYLLKTILSYNEPGKDVSTRNDYYNNYQEAFVYLLEKCFSLSYSDFQGLFSSIIQKAILDQNSIQNIDEVLKIVTDYLDKKNITYDNDLLKASIEKLIDFILGPLMPLKNEAILYLNNLKAALAMHYPLSTYLLLNYYYETEK